MIFSRNAELLASSPTSRSGDSASQNEILTFVRIAEGK